MKNKTKSNSKSESSKICNIEFINNILEGAGFTTTMGFQIRYNQLYITGVKKKKGDKKKTHPIYNKMINGVDEKLVSPSFFTMLITSREVTPVKRINEVLKGCEFLVDISYDGKQVGVEETAKKVMFNIINILEENKALSKHGFKVPAKFSQIKIQQS